MRSRPRRVLRIEREGPVITRQKHNAVEVFVLLVNVRAQTTADDKHVEQCGRRGFVWRLTTTSSTP